MHSQKDRDCTSSASSSKGTQKWSLRIPSEWHVGSRTNVFELQRKNSSYEENAAHTWEKTEPESI